MNITVEDKSKVDKVLSISASADELSPRFEQAYRTYKKKINMPGFRPGSVPVSIVKKRFGKEIEAEEINNYIQEIFQKEVVPKYQPIGEPQFEDLKWENGELEARIIIGVKPEFTLKEISSFTVDKMVHDVTDEEVDEEVNQSVKRASSWEETDDVAGEESKVVVDAVPLDKEGNPQEDKKDSDKEMDLSDDQHKEFRDALKGAKAGADVEITLGEGDDSETFRLTVKKVMTRKAPELNEDFISGVTNGAVTTLEDYRSHIKSQIQNYYDQVSADMVKQEIMEELIEAHPEIEIPESVLRKFQDAHLERMKQQLQGQSLPEDFDAQKYRESIKGDASREARWAFIIDELDKKYDDIEITPEDVDGRLAGEAARYGLPTEMVKNFYAQSGDQLENLRQNIRTDKLFDRILEQVKLNELGKEAYQDKKKKKRNDESDK